MSADMGPRMSWKERAESPQEEEEDEAEEAPQPYDGEDEDGTPFNFDFLSIISEHKDYYKILEVDYDATDDTIRSNYIRLALKWHPDKKKDQGEATSRFQEINEAYQVLSDPVKRQEYDQKGMFHVFDYNVVDYLNRYKGLILTCNGLGIRQSICLELYSTECDHGGCRDRECGLYE
ncbi:hypothetical protein MLD38_022406 [Melastoma candidum]|uniref:Uncharacterized protein n=1 Tax=Melastoma candidum TaxID=119954 RepID=A0ACB9QIB8_9MYRT|nr:hypothetical protein MLD38_022406 [Melastoma candidum]